jgi:hypothetical protein
VTDLAVIVPTVKRADMLEALVFNIHEVTQTKHRIYLVLESDDEESLKVAKGLDSVDVVGEYGSNATAVNGGYRASKEPFLAIVNDDCLFHRGWDLAALKYFSDDVHVVGLNQGDGTCKCFFMVRRSYIEEHSGVFDKPNTLFHTYASQFPDTEFAEYAQHRGVWAEAQDSLVEHMHWTFGKGDANHPNYRKAVDTFAADQAVYAARRSEY